MFKTEIFEEEATPGNNPAHGNVLIICRAIGQPGRAVIQIKKPTWERLRFDDSQLELFRLVLKLSGETLMRLRKSLYHEHYCRQRFLECGLEYRRKSGVKVQYQGEPLLWIIRQYESHTANMVKTLEQALSDLCGSEILVNVAWPGHVSVYEILVLREECIAA